MSGLIKSIWRSEVLLESMFARVFYIATVFPVGRVEVEKLCCHETHSFERTAEVL